MRILISSTHVIPNSIFIAQTLIKLNIHTTNYILITPDINDIYVHITINETIQITKYILQHNFSKTLQHQMLHTVVHQNYFRFNDNFYKPSKDIATGSPVSYFVAETFLHYFGNNHENIIESKHTVFYACYVDDISII
jgi:hypothetical protein